MARSVKIAVVGAGVSGLVAAREFQREGHKVVVFEKNHRIGGTWVYDPRTESDPLGIDPNRETVHSSLYLSMRTNLPRQVMGYLDYPFVKRESGDRRTFPGHEEVLRFLDGFAEEFGILKLIRIEAEVARVERVGEGNDGWVVVWKRRGSEHFTREEFDAVAVCSGHHSMPKLAEIPGIQNWRRFQMHSHNYRVPDPFRGQVVVIIGLGPSGFDISKDIAKLAKEVHISVRLSHMFMKLNLQLQDLHNISHHPTIKCVYEDGLVAFEDGSSVYADSIIHCTGYKYDIPFLETRGIVSVENNRVGPLYKHVFPPSFAPSLSFIGFTSLGSTFEIAELQSKWVARVLCGKAKLPSEEEMMHDVQSFYEFMQQNQIPKHFTHTLRPYQPEYKQWLVEQSGLEGGLEEWREKIYEECFQKFLEMQHLFRDQWDDAYWDSIIHSASSSSIPK